MCMLSLLFVEDWSLTDLDLDTKKHINNYVNNLTGEQHLAKLTSVTKTIRLRIKE